MSLTKAISFRIDPVTGFADVRNLGTLLLFAFLAVAVYASFFKTKLSAATRGEISMATVWLVGPFIPGACKPLTHHHSFHLFQQLPASSRLCGSRWPSACCTHPASGTACSLGCCWSTCSSRVRQATRESRSRRTPKRRLSSSCISHTHRSIINPVSSVRSKEPQSTRGALITVIVLVVVGLYTARCVHQV